MKMEGRKTEVQFWNEAWKGDVRARVPSPLNIGVLNSMRLLRKHIQRGMSVLEVGYAPGKLLAWVATTLGASVSGIDYSPNGVAAARQLFKQLDVPADLRCEDIFAPSFTLDAFDVVYSFGLIEHFDDPHEIVRQHVLLARPGGRILIAVPNYGGFYGSLQSWCDPENLEIHNLEIMSPVGLRKLVPADLVAKALAYYSGRLSPWLISLNGVLPSPIAHSISLLLNGMGLLQPFDMAPVCPLVVLEMERR